jgi:hypothetical protein
MDRLTGAAGRALPGAEMPVMAVRSLQRVGGRRASPAGLGQGLGALSPGSCDAVRQIQSEMSSGRLLTGWASRLAGAFGHLGRDGLPLLAPFLDGVVTSSA